MKRNKIIYAFAVALLALALCLAGCGPDGTESGSIVPPDASTEVLPTPEATPEATPEPPEATPEPPVITPPAATSDPASNSDIVLYPSRPSTDTDIPEE